MKSSQRIVLELKKINGKLDRVSNSDRYMVYNANPLKFAWFNFLGGIFHSLGSLFGTVVVAAILVYLFSKIDVIKPLTDWIQNISQQVQIQQLPSQFQAK